MIWLLLSSGRGPGECELAVRGIALALLQEAKASSGLAASLLEVEAAADGWLSALIALEGDAAMDFARSCEGTIRWTCPSPLRRDWPRKNWFIGASLLKPPETAGTLEERDLRFDVCRASGPGGQHVNKTNSAVRVTHLPTGLVAQAQEERSQYRNRALAIARLAAQLADRGRAAQAAARRDRRDRHDALERGGEKRVYSGPDFTRVK